VKLFYSLKKYNPSHTMRHISCVPAILVFTALFSLGCKNYIYHYHPLPVNQAAASNKGEVQLGGCIGTSGATSKGAVAISDKLTIAGQYNGRLNGAAYNANEGELALGYNTAKNARGHVFTLYGGYGLGSNFRLDSGATLKDFKGDFQLGFLQFGMASTQGHIGRVRTGTTAAMKLNYINYRGDLLGSNMSYNQFTASNFFLDMYLGANIGGKYWRLEMAQGFVVKTDLKSLTDPSHNLHVFPITFNLGLTIIIGREYKADSDKDKKSENTDD
jgi:hypothetical protein